MYFNGIQRKKQEQIKACTERGNGGYVASYYEADFFN
jgi:hypothetical protein